MSVGSQWPRMFLIAREVSRYSGFMNSRFLYIVSLVKSKIPVLENCLVVGLVVDGQPLAEISSPSD